MNIPNVPTDNMYKFQAIVGLLILLSSLIFSFFTLQEATTEYHDNKADIESVKIEMKYLDLDITRIEKELGILSKKTILSDDERSKYLADGNELSELLKTVKSIELKSVVKQEKLNQLTDRINNVKLIMNFGLLFGGFWFVYGLWMWNKKLQIYEDIIIKRKAEKLS